MKNFLKNTKGAVTVFVTLLIIPAMLISGTAVDLARLYTARSILHNANALAANAVLAQYNALAHDLYGIFGVSENDPVMARLLDDYIYVTVYGEQERDTDAGTLHIFYGSKPGVTDIFFPDNKNLRNPDVLLRQIQEYMKLRAPVIVVNEYLTLPGLDTIKEDTQVLRDKLEIDAAMSGLLGKYEDLYRAIKEADICDKVPAITASSLGTVTSVISKICDEFKNLGDCYERWTNSTTAAQKADYAAQYAAILKNIETWVYGGTIGKGWSNGTWTGSSNTQGLEETIIKAVPRTDNFKPKFDTVTDIAKQIDVMTAALISKVNILESHVINGGCSDILRSGLTNKIPGSGMSVIDMYKEALKYNNIEVMATIYQTGGYEYIDGPLKELIADVGYRNRKGSGISELTLGQLGSISSNSNMALTAQNNYVTTITGFSHDDVTYKMPEGFLKFADCSAENEEFFGYLSLIMNRSYPLPSEPKAELSGNPLGAGYIGSNEGGIPSNLQKGIYESIGEAASHPVLDVIANPEASIIQTGEAMLLLTYCTSMFSNFTTGKSTGSSNITNNQAIENRQLTPAGIPLGQAVNYFYQSEWEYIYTGSSNAYENLHAAAQQIYIIRAVCNYITAFDDNEVISKTDSIRTQFEEAPLLAVIYAEAQRTGCVAAQSAEDITGLRQGRSIPLLKGENTQLTYPDYMTYLFLSKRLQNPAATREMTNRTANLIEWNVINYKDGINCDENRMTQSTARQGNFNLSDMKTDLSITITADMKMLFLSQRFARSFSDTRSLGMPGKVPLSVTDYRGY